MPRFAANLTLLFNEVPFLERFERAAKAGFDAVEILFPYEWPIAEIKARLEGHGLQLVLLNLPPGDWDAGERGLACVPERIGEFREGVARGIEVAKALGAPQLNCLSGITPRGSSADLIRSTYIDNLGYTAIELKKVGLNALIEPINTIDVPGIYLNRTAQALAAIADVGSDNLFLQYDVYHAQRSEGELAATIEKYLAQIGHIQIADNPGRHEPGSGEINYNFLFAHLDRIGYRGWVSAEYRPLAETEAGLGWLARARQRATESAA